MDFLVVDDGPLTYIPDYFELINPGDTPIQNIWALPLMYRIGNNGVMYLWQVGFDGTQLLRMHGPQRTTTVDYRAVNLNTSGRNIQEQALLQARQMYKDKYLKGYSLPSTVEDKHHVTGMKGYPYKEGDIKEWPVLISPKLDGVRMLARHIGGEQVKCLTYFNNEYTNLAHMEREIIMLSMYLPNECTLDGELYCHDMSQQEIVSAVKTVTRDHPDLLRLSFCIFDTYHYINPPSEIRYNQLVGAFDAYERDNDPFVYLCVVPKYCAESHQHAVEWKNYFISQDYEGAVINLMANGKTSGKGYENSRYKFGRSRRLFKLKDNIDEEAIVIGIIPAEGKERDAGLLVIRDIRGNVINQRFGTIEDRKKWLKNPNLVVGKRFTFKYARLSDDGVPIMPVGVNFRDYE